jgi:ABC-2 type transport system permease protein
MTQPAAPGTTPTPTPASGTAATARPRLPSVGRLLLGQIRYQLSLLLATPNALFIGIGLPVLLLILFHPQRGSFPAASVAGVAIFGLTVTAWNTHGIRLVQAREAGVLKRWRATPLPRWCYFLGRIVTTALFSTAAGAVTIAVAVLVYHGHITAVAAAAMLIAMSLGALAWAAAATAITGLIPTAESANPIFMLVYFPVVFISGALGATSVLPRWLTTLASDLPAQPMVGALTSSLRHTAGGPFLPGRDVAVLVAWVVAGLAAAAVLFRWEPHRPAVKRPARSRA